MDNSTIFLNFENRRTGRQARNLSENAPKILDLKSSSKQIIFRKLSLGAPVMLYNTCYVISHDILCYITHNMLCYITHVMPGYISHVMFCYITHVMPCYITHVMFCYITNVMLCYITHVMLCYITRNTCYAML